MPKNKRLHFKDIDGIKGILSISLIVFCSLSIYDVKGEELGLLSHFENFLFDFNQNIIDFFFLTSSFLVTSQGLREYKYLKSFSLKNYVIRRILRLLPVFILALLFAFMWHPWLVKILGLRALEPLSIINYITFIPNYTSNPSGDQAIYLAVLFFIYMLIQQYLFLGILLKFLDKYLSIIGVVLILIGLAWRIIYILLAKEYLFDTVAYFTPMGIGILLALVIRNDHAIVHKLKMIAKSNVILIYAIGFLFMLTSQFILKGTLFEAIIPLILGIFYSYIIIEQTFGKNSIIKFRTLKIFTRLGKMSYGLIMYNALISILFMIGIESLDYDLNKPLLLVIVFISSFILTIIITNISFKLFEKPLSRIKKDFKRV